MKGHFRLAQLMMIVHSDELNYCTYATSFIRMIADRANLGHVRVKIVVIKGLYLHRVDSKDLNRFFREFNHSVSYFYSIML